MTEAQMQRVFAPFTQADGSITRRFGGTGLGLSIAQQLAEQMGGDLTVRSRPHMGTTFELSLPLPAQQAGGAGHDGHDGHVAPAAARAPIPAPAAASCPALDFAASALTACLQTVSTTDLPAEEA
jgi:hypothetical protein